jgi:hypothetical protein
MSSIVSLPQEYATRIILKVRELFIKLHEAVINKPGGSLAVIRFFIEEIKE